MAKFLDTQAISNELMKLIKDAKEKIILVSPYLKVNTQIQERLRTRSKIGTLSEIVIVYGKSDLKDSEISWIKEIDDLKVYEKINLHAKCYVSEDRAIICSMNLYDYSQQHNIEMGLLITRDQDKEAYQDLMEEINNIKINGKRKKFNESGLIETVNQNSKATEEVLENNKHHGNVVLTNDQKLRFQILKQWRLAKSKAEKVSAYMILTDEEIRSIVCCDRVDRNRLFEILPKKKAIRFADEVMDELSNASKYTIGKVLNVWYQDDNGYDRVKLKVEHTGEEKWFDTVKELPTKEKYVGARLNNNWFNEYFYLEN